MLFLLIDAVQPNPTMAADPASAAGSRSIDRRERCFALASLEICQPSVSWESLDRESYELPRPVFIARDPVHLGHCQHERRLQPLWDFVRETPCPVQF
jgi:hypothetical protein